jgi:hypothetical protein
MVTETPSMQEPRDWAIKRCGKLIRAHATGAIGQDELFYNLTVVLIHAAIIDAESGSRLRDGWKPSLALLPPELVRAWGEWIEQEIVAADYMPSPHAFMVDTRDTRAVEAKRRELRPLYVALHNLVRV